MSSPVKFQSIIPDDFNANFALSLTHTTLSSPWGLGLFSHLVYPPNDDESIWKKRIVYWVFFSMCSAIRGNKEFSKMCAGEYISSFSWVVLTAQWLDCSGIDSQRRPLDGGRGSVDFLIFGREWDAAMERDGMGQW